MIPGRSLSPFSVIVTCWTRTFGRCVAENSSVESLRVERVNLAVLCVERHNNTVDKASTTVNIPVVRAEIASIASWLALAHSIIAKKLEKISCTIDAAIRTIPPQHCIPRAAGVRYSRARMIPRASRSLILFPTLIPLSSVRSSIISSSAFVMLASNSQGPQKARREARSQERSAGVEACILPAQEFPMPLRRDCRAARALRVVTLRMAKIEVKRVQSTMTKDDKEPHWVAVVDYGRFEVEIPLCGSNSKTMAARLGLNSRRMVKRCRAHDHFCRRLKEISLLGFFFVTGANSRAEGGVKSLKV